MENKNSKFSTLNSQLNIISIIPARMGSSRFPGKPMKEISGMPMIIVTGKQIGRAHV